MACCLYAADESHAKEEFQFSNDSRPDEVSLPDFSNLFS
jgi:hypothetical protein